MTRVLMAEATDYRGTTHVGSHAIARAFVADGAQVCWVGTPLYMPSFVRAQRDPQTARRVRAWRRGGMEADSGVVEYYPLTLLPVLNRPLLDSSMAARNTLRFTVPPIASVLQKLGFDQPDVLWLSNSRFSHAMPGVVRAKVSACRISDDWAHFGHVPAALIEQHDAMVNACDIVFVTSLRLKEKLHARRPDAIYLPNGVADFFFAAPVQEPAMLSRFSRPRIVFVGKLDAWVDFDTIAATAERNPTASVLVVGPGTPAPRSYPSNVHFTGAFPYHDLPALLNACDVGLVPFVKSELTHAVSPLKLFEYLACGLPVVATRLDEIERTTSPAILCDTVEEFASAVTTVLNGNRGGRDARIAFAREHTWSRRFDIVKHALRARGIA